jgi:glycine cleavage system aminomethyltransferase T
MSQERDFSRAPGSARISVLYEEHLLLSATFGDRLASRPPVPSAYGDGSGELAALERGTALSDLSGMACLLFSGPAATGFAHAAFAGRELAVGECAFECVLMGDGRLASVPLLARTGDEEFAVLDASPRSQLLASWLTFLANVESGGVEPYRDLVAENVTGSLVPLLLAGADATAIASDYLPEGAVLPARGQVRSIALDGRIASLVARVDPVPTAAASGRGAATGVAHAGRPAVAGPAYLLLVPPDSARTVWRSLLSFESLAPVGEEALRHHLVARVPWASWLDGGPEGPLAARDLVAAGIARPQMDFLGARGLA